MPKPPKKDPSIKSDLPFEDALEQLEELVREMESDQIPLDDLIKNYEEGARLYRVCEKRLDEARGRIEIIRTKRNGEHVLEPFGEGSESRDQTEATSGDSQKNGELF